MRQAVPLLVARGVSFSRQAEAGQRLPILQETHLQVDSGEILAVVGPSGSGKSTLLRLFNRLLEPDRGQILLAGQDIRTLPPPLYTDPYSSRRAKAFPFLRHGSQQSADTGQAATRGIAGY